MPNLNAANVSAMPVPFLPVERQEVSRGGPRSIDDLIENNRRRVELLEQMAQAIYREWFVRFRYPGHEDATSRRFPLGPIPEGWRRSRRSRRVRERLCEAG